MWPTQSPPHRCRANTTDAVPRNVPKMKSFRPFLALWAKIFAASAISPRVMGFHPSQCRGPTLTSPAKTGGTFLPAQLLLATRLIIFVAMAPGQKRHLPHAAKKIICEMDMIQKRRPRRNYPASRCFVTANITQVQHGAPPPYFEPTPFIQKNWCYRTKTLPL